MEKAIEFNIENEELKEYLEECIREEKIDYEINIEDRWVEKYREASNYYQVYCLYVNSNNLKKIEEFMQNFESGRIITNGIEELQNIDEEDEKKKNKEKAKYNDNEKNKDNRFKIFTLKNFLKYYWLAIFLMGILIIIAIKFQI